MLGSSGSPSADRAVRKRGRQYALGRKVDGIGSTRLCGAEAHPPSGNWRACLGREDGFFCPAWSGRRGGDDAGPGAELRPRTRLPGFRLIDCRSSGDRSRRVRLLRPRWRLRRSRALVRLPARPVAPFPRLAEEECPDFCRLWCSAAPLGWQSPNPDHLPGGNERLIDPIDKVRPLTQQAPWSYRMSCPGGRHTVFSHTLPLPWSIAHAPGNRLPFTILRPLRPSRGAQMATLYQVSLCPQGWQHANGSDLRLPRAPRLPTINDGSRCAPTSLNVQNDCSGVCHHRQRGRPPPVVAVKRGSIPQHTRGVLLSKTTSSVSANTRAIDVGRAWHPPCQIAPTMPLSWESPPSLGCQRLRGGLSGAPYPRLASASGDWPGLAPSAGIVGRGCGPAIGDGRHYCIALAALSALRGSEDLVADTGVIRREPHGEVDVAQQPPQKPIAPRGLRGGCQTAMHGDHAGCLAVPGTDRHRLGRA
jgi:hypothetical protein